MLDDLLVSYSNAKSPQEIYCIGWEVAAALLSMHESGVYNVECMKSDAELCWRLLSWVEGSTIDLYHQGGDSRCRACCIALCMLTRGAIDMREVLLVGALVRRGAMLANLDFRGILSSIKPNIPWDTDVVEKLSGETPDTHVEKECNGRVVFLRKNQGIDVDRLIQRFGD